MEMEAFCGKRQNSCDMPNRITAVQVCDARDDDSSNAARLGIKNLQIERIIIY